MAHENVTNRKKDEMKILRLSYFDRLTGLPNRNLLRQELAPLLARAEHISRKVAVLSVDLDGIGGY